MHNVNLTHFILLSPVLTIIMKLLCLLLIAILFIQEGFVEATSATYDTSAQALSQGQGDAAGGNQGGLHDQKYRINCSAECSRRCIRSSRRKICYRACTSCCARCNCVPPGTYGNTHLCPCYASLRTHGNRLKCP